MFEVDYKSFKQSLEVHDLINTVIHRELGITKEMSKYNYKDFLIEVISMLNREDQIDIIDAVGNRLAREK